jgi:hypothetical protein
LKTLVPPDVPKNLFILTLVEKSPKISVPIYGKV